MNTHPFDLRLARDAQWPLVCRDGRKAEVLKFDRQADDPLVGLVHEKPDYQSVISWMIGGHAWPSKTPDGRDLFLSADYQNPDVRAAVQRALEKLGMEVVIKNGLAWEKFGNNEHPAWLWDSSQYRLAIHVPAPPKIPWSLTRHIPGFRELLPSEEFHRLDFTEADLPEGWRPLLTDEVVEQGDQYFALCKWQSQVYASRFKGDVKHRTRRPLPPAPKVVAWDYSTKPKERGLWVVKKGYISERQIVAWRDDGVEVGGTAEKAEKVAYSELLSAWKQVDGSPCGMEVK